MKILVTGAGGMVGQATVKHCQTLGDEVAAHTRQTCDIADAAQTLELLRRERPDYVVNCAAWTDVDGCESDPERAFRDNAAGPENLACACREIGAGLITISTDYVFDGAKDGFYTQRDNPNPLGVYAQSKLDGERLAQNASARTIIARTGWIFGPGGRNFLSRVAELARGGASLSAIHDAYGTPTYALDLAARLRDLAEMDLPGVFHVVNSGDGASYAEFARVAPGPASAQYSSALFVVGAFRFATAARLGSQRAPLFQHLGLSHRWAQINTGFFRFAMV